jgi:hypothetical protein
VRDGVYKVTIGCLLLGAVVDRDCGMVASADRWAIPDAVDLMFGPIPTLPSPV